MDLSLSRQYMSIRPSALKMLPDCVAFRPGPSQNCNVLIELHPLQPPPTTLPPNPVELHARTSAAWRANGTERYNQAASR
jgi:hypothetical protein